MKIRKALATLSACMSLVSVKSVFFTAEATGSPYDGDINGDGSVSMMDMVALSRYLNGECKLSDYQAADVNCTFTINALDVAIIQAYIIENIDSLPHANTPLTGSYTMQEMENRRNYYARNCATGAETYYYLESNDVPLFNSSSRTGVVDDRVPDTDVSVVKILPSGGTGFIIDDHIIATAAHCLYDKKTESYVQNPYVEIVNESSTESLATLTVRETHIPYVFKEIPYDENSDNSNYYFMYDYALVYVEEDLSQYGMFDLSVQADEFTTNSPIVTVSGFAQRLGFNRYKASGAVQSLSGSNIENQAKNQLLYSAYMSNGQSGGPVYVTETFNGQEHRSVVAINTSGAAPSFYGTRITPDLLRFFCNNDYISSTVS